MPKVIDYKEVFNFKEFDLYQSNEVMKVGTDGILLGAWTAHDPNSKILDIGTGSGLLALMMAQKYQNANISGLDIDNSACNLARHNFQISPWDNRLEIIQQSVQEHKVSATYDLIVSNPPFFNRKDLFDQSARQGMRNSIKLPHGDLLRAVSDLLVAEGCFCVILPHLEGLRFIEMASMYSLFPKRITEVFSKVDQSPKRILLKFVKQNNQPSKDQLNIYNTEGKYTLEYRSLTEAYYK